LIPIVGPFLHDPKNNDLDLCDKGRLIKETAISHTFSRDTTNPHMPFVPIPISTHPNTQNMAPTSEKDKDHK
jgi:hypothetical protein